MPILIAYHAFLIRCARGGAAYALFVNQIKEDVSVGKYLIKGEILARQYLFADEFPGFYAAPVEQIVPVQLRENTFRHFEGAFCSNEINPVFPVRLDGRYADPPGPHFKTLCPAAVTKKFHSDAIPYKT